MCVFDLKDLKYGAVVKFMSSICLVSLDEARSFEARSLAKALALDFISEGTLDPKATLRDQRRFQKALLKDRQRFFYTTLKD